MSLAVFLCALACAGMAVLVWVGLASDARQQPVGFVFLCALNLLNVILLGMFWQQQKPRQLLWTGSQWQLQSSGPASRTVDARSLQLMHCRDFQLFVLLQCREPGLQRKRWLWVERQAENQDWHLFRCAVHASLERAQVDGVPAASDLGKA